MATDERMPKVDLVKEKASLNVSTSDWMKIIEKQNLKRVEQLRKTRKSNVITGLALSAGVLSIYAYSLLAVKQETFLDDFEEPKLAPVQENK